MKVRHRTLWVAKSGGMNTTKCAMTGCLHEENIEHLVDCPLIRRGFRAKIETLMRTLKMETGCRLFWLFGLKPGLNKWRAADAEEAEMINWAWRALYTHHPALKKQDFCACRSSLAESQAPGRFFNHRSLWCTPWAGEYFFKIRFKIL
jgi:hypothetical protein